MALQDVLNALNESDVTSATTSRLAGEGGVSPAQVAAYATDEAYDAPMMVLSQINEA